MKKILIIIVIILLLVLNFIVITKSVKVAKFKIESINNIKASSKALDESLKDAEKLTQVDYPQKLDQYKASLRKLDSTKEDYTSKLKYNTEDINLGKIQIDRYKIQFLWTIIGNYAKENDITLTLNVTDAATSGLYNLKFIAVGTYLNITDFLYNLESDNELQFKIENFSLKQGAKLSLDSKGNIQKDESGKPLTTNTTDYLEAQFEVRDIVITMD